MQTAQAASAHAPFDLLIRAGRLFCPTSGWNGPGAVGIRGDRIAAAADETGGGQQPAGDPSALGPAAARYAFPNGVLLPGLIDLHAHPAKSGSVFGVDPDACVLQRGTTTVGSQGDAGAGNWRQYLAETIETSQARVLLAMNLSRVGESAAAGCFERLEDADVDACVQAIERAGEHAWAIAVNVSHNACGRTDPRIVLSRGLAAAEATGLPLLFGMRRPGDWPLGEQLERLRAGDVVTYCFRRVPHCIVSGGRVLPEVREARRRGVLFDVGHGAASFDFDVAAAAIAAGFPPDTISTDLQRRHVGESPPHDLPLTMSKLRAAGMPADDVFRAVTRAAAQAMRRPQLGTLAAGAGADVTVLQWRDDGILADTSGDERQAGRWTAVATVRGGRMVRVADPDQ